MLLEALRQALIIKFQSLNEKITEKHEIADNEESESTQNGRASAVLFRFLYYSLKYNRLSEFKKNECPLY